MYLEERIVGGRSRAHVGGYVLIRRLCYKVNKTAKCLGRDIVTVSSPISRFVERMGGDEELRKQVDRIANLCSIEDPVSRSLTL
jgi:hypothetical protein